MLKTQRLARRGELKLPSSSETESRGEACHGYNICIASCERG